MVDLTKVLLEMALLCESDPRLRFRLFMNANEAVVATEFQYKKFLGLVQPIKCPLLSARIRIKIEIVQDQVTIIEARLLGTDSTLS